MELSELEQWFATRPKWLQDASRRLVEKGELAEQDFQELQDLLASFDGISPHAAAKENSRQRQRGVCQRGIESDVKQWFCLPHRRPKRLPKYSGGNSVIGKVY